MYVVYLAAAIFALAEAEDIVVHFPEYWTNKVKNYTNTTVYTMEELDSMFTTFHSLQSIMKVFNKPEYRELIEVQELLRTYELKKAELLNRMSSTENITHSHPFIVIDGFQGSGKLTMTRRLAATIVCRFIASPPSYLTRLRVGFDCLNFELRSAFYALINYLTAYNVMIRRQYTPVIMNRFWHTTLSYALATNFVQFGVYPDTQSIIFNWPSDLIKPDAVYILDRSFYNSHLPSKMIYRMKDAFKTIKGLQTIVFANHSRSSDFEELFLDLIRDIQRRNIFPT